ncbi:MAG: hypothetical protein HC816_21370 [Leptolyngbyaceae cyanobacterium RM1_1_2]|nr:hypothetical protein [Leptolyngbyaceae cyanobacterium RM1_1_2]
MQQFLAAASRQLAARLEAASNNSEPLTDQTEQAVRQAEVNFNSSLAAPTHFALAWGV